MNENGSTLVGTNGFAVNNRIFSYRTVSISCAYSDLCRILSYRNVSKLSRVRDLKRAMQTLLHTLHLDLNWSLVSQLSRLDRYDAEWSAIERRQGNHLQQLRFIETVKSVAASTRIEGSLMTDGEVEALLEGLNVQTLTERDQQEVAGYYDALILILDSWADMDVSESTIMHLHKVMLAHSDKDAWHAGGYKQQSNAVEATLPDGTSQVIFRATEPGMATEEAMRSAMSWYAQERQAHPLVAGAVLVYEVLSIHPFQKGNGRLSRLLTTLILLKSGYSWIQYVSFEHEIEQRKTAYYRVLRSCQVGRPGEDVTPWVSFFLGTLSDLTLKLDIKLRESGVDQQLSGRESSVLKLIGNRPHIQSAELSERLDIPLPSVKRILADLVEAGLIERHGKGRGTDYTRL